MRYKICWSQHFSCLYPFLWNRDSSVGVVNGLCDGKLRNLPAEERNVTTWVVVDNSILLSV